MWKGKKYMPRSRQVAGGKETDRKRENTGEYINREPFSAFRSSSFRQLHAVFSLLRFTHFLFLVLARPATDHSAHTHYYLFSVYNDFEYVFSTENAGHQSFHKDHDHAIDLIDGKQPLYGPIYSLSENELLILQTYIANNLANRFIRPSKFLAGAPILFVPKPNGDLWLYVDYLGLNNLTIKNRYLLPLVGKFLDRLDRAKQYIKLDLTDAYYRIRIKKGEK